MRGTVFMALGRIAAALLIIGVALSGGHCFAQTVAIAQISGIVRDPSGGAVPNAEVKAVQTDTQLVRTTLTDSSGGYVLPAGPVGPYRLEVTAGGFKTYVQSGIVLEVGNNVQINPSLPLGTVNENVEVRAQSSMVQTTDSTISQVIDQRRIVDLPLNGRQPTRITSCSPRK